KGVSYIINISSDKDSIGESISLAHKYDFIYASVGLHPQSCKNFSERDLDYIAQKAADPKVVAIGEIGLDYYYDSSFSKDQQKAFALQIGLAKSMKLPIIVHDRDAHEDIMKIIKSENAGAAGGTFHAFSGSVEMAKEVLKNEFYISVGGVVTFKNARKLLDVVRYVPLERLLIETDCPYLAPHPFRGTRNDSGHLKYIAMKIAELKSDTFENVAAITAGNAKKLFNIGG
ncbi:MAG: TatD family hydrolase, partial [Eubacteriales bacterium]|nr:TatD family hydrolase [Eubacteriales bacterium]